MRYAIWFLILSVTLCGCQEQGSVDWLARIIAVLGSLVGVGGLVLGIRNFLWDRKKWEILRKERQEDKDERKREKEEEAKSKAEQNRERVIASVSFGSFLGGKNGDQYQHDCMLRIYNPCPFTISIKSVMLWFANAEEKAKGNKSGHVLPMFPQSSSSSRTNKLSANTTAELESRKEVYFKCVDLDKEDLCNAPLKLDHQN